MEEAAKTMDGMPYGFSGVAKLWAVKSAFGGPVKQVNPLPRIVLKNPFCSQAVANICWVAGRAICRPPKLEPEAVGPESIRQYAIEKGTDLNIVFEC